MDRHMPRQGSRFFTYSNESATILHYHVRSHPPIPRAPFPKGLVCLTDRAPGGQVSRKRCIPEY